MTLDYTRHVIVSHTAGPGIAFWRFARPGSSVLLAEVAVTPRAIMITGDGPNLIIGGGPLHPAARLRWFAESTLGGYIEVKVRASKYAANGVSAGLDWRHDRAMDDLTAGIAQADKDDERALLNGVVGASRAACRREFIEALEDAGVDSPWEYGFGEATRREVIQAREMVAALLVAIGGEAEAAR
jgi:hypothetical protein